MGCASSKPAVAAPTAAPPAAAARNKISSQSRQPPPPPQPRPVARESTSDRSSRGRSTQSSGRDEGDDSFPADAHDRITASHQSSHASSNKTKHSATSSFGDASISSVGALAPPPSEAISSRGRRHQRTPSQGGVGLASASSSHSAPPPKEKGSVDQRWEYLFATLSPHLLDPEDLPAVLDAAISQTINRLSPAEVSFIRRRAKEAARLTIAAEGNGSGGVAGPGYVSSGGSEGKRASVSKKIGRLVGYSSHHGDKSGNNNIGHPALDESDHRAKSSRAVIQKERLMDVTTFRTLFAGGARGLRELRARAKAERADLDSSSTSAEPRRRRSAERNSLAEDPPACKTPDMLDAEALARVDVYGAAFLLLLYLSESRWDYVAEIAKLSAKEAGLVRDVNKLALRAAEDEKERGKNGSKKGRSPKRQASATAAGQGTTPPPPRPPSSAPPSEIYNDPDLTAPEPGGIRLSSLCFLVATALRGSRRQRLGLLFHLLLPPPDLHALLASHLAGGLPTWLLETDNETVLTYDSLGYYYHYDGVMLPLKGHRKEGDAFAPGRKRLCIDAKSAVEVLATLLSATLGADESQGSIYGTQLLSSQLEAADRQEVNTLSSVQCQDVTEMLTRAAHDGRTAAASLSPDEKDQIENFSDLAGALRDNASMSNDDSVRLSWSMADFVEWADAAMDETVLDRILHRLFGTGILPSATMERQLVAQRWIDWNLRRLESRPSNTTSTEMGEGQPAPAKRGIGKMFAGHESDQTSDEANAGTAHNAVWGGIGGIDGKGGLGAGVLYCIDKRWWDEWAAFTGWKIGESHRPSRRSSLKRPRELSSERLMDRSADAAYVSGTRGSYELMRRSLVLGEDYVLVPPGVWNILYEMYGGGPPLPRMILPENESNGAESNGGVDHALSIEDESVEVISEITKTEQQSYPKEIPASIRVATHPWILHCQICDPHQPYRRGDAGPMSIRIMAMPDQPLWRLFAEIVVRLPISHPKGHDSQGEGRARLWRFEVANGKAPNAGGRYGPWALLCKNRFAEIPVGAPSYDKYEEQWEAYADQHSVESSGLSDGMRLMFEHAVTSKDGSFTWPREAAAKATIARRIADEDTAFRLMLRGLDPNGEPSKHTLMRKAVDAMDASGRWFQGIIVNVDNASKSSEPESKTEGMGSNGSTSEANKDRPPFRENTHVRIQFHDQTDNHQEWIEVKSDRLAVRGRMTAITVGNGDSEHDSEEAAASSDSKSRIAAGINKKKDTSDMAASDPNSSGVCQFPGYGACGLMNLGNTCYANSGWQCMSYLPLLRAYLLSGQFKINGDINRDNPLGTGGKILEEFSELLHFMWSGKYGARAPQKFRSFLAKCRTQYSGADQQDAQELLNDMFDMLHEDGNRVRKKPYVEALEDKFIEKTDLSRVGQEAWRRFLRRNRSAISDLAMGQVYNRVTCPVCNHSSKNFDPFTMLSLPFPTVAEVIFQCTVVRRASALNCPNTLGHIARRNQPREKSSKVPPSNLSPPSKDLIFEEYLIPMSRLADIGDLKMKLQNLSGIQAKELRVCKKEDIDSNASDHRHSFTKLYTKVTALPDKEGPCVKLIHQDSLDEVSSPTIARIVAFESTLVVRPIEVSNSMKSTASKGDTTDDASTTADEMSTDSSTHAVTAIYQSKREERLVQEYLKVYGDEKECLEFDTNPTPLAKVISRSLWPKTTDDFTLGLRVDAIDHRNHWFPGSVIEIIVDDAKDAEDPAGETQTKVKIHFDNFSAKWDEVYSIEQFEGGRVCPLYSHATPRPKPTEFIAHHRGQERKTKKCYLFGQSFYLQCHNEWSTARAGAHILAQASRFLEVSHFATPENGKKLDAIDRKIAEKERHEARKVIAKVIEALIRSDRKHMEAAIARRNGLYGDKGERTQLDVSYMSQVLSKKLSEVLPLLPFDVRVTTANAPLGSNSEEHPFPFSLVRTIGNYMNARHSLVLHWREKPDGPNTKSSERRHSGSSRQFLYSQPHLATHKQSRALLNANQNDASSGNALKRHPSSSHGGLHIGACLTEFCKEQQLDATGCWRCPTCKAEREGKQSMTLWNLPDLLTFHLKRFNASSRWREKISTKVDFPLTGLNMREWCDAESPLCQESDDDAFIYDLVGVVNHLGGMTGGHYVATCKATACSPDGDEDVAYNFNGAGISELGSAEGESATSGGFRMLGRSKEKESSSNAATKAVAESAEPLWLQFDDEMVEPLPPRNVVSETAYVLFYRRRRMHPANIAKYSSI
ncbi:hypothetical protein ACHAXT_003118 [Thalassiosira profunda]